MPDCFAQVKCWELSPGDLCDAPPSNTHNALGQGGDCPMIPELSVEEGMPSSFPSLRVALLCILSPDEGLSEVMQRQRLR